MGKFVVGKGYMCQEEYAAYLDLKKKLEKTISDEDKNEEEDKKEDFVDRIDSKPRIRQNLAPNDVKSYYMWILPFLSFILYYVHRVSYSLFQSSNNKDLENPT